MAVDICQQFVCMFGMCICVCVVVCIAPMTPPIIHSSRLTVAHPTSQAASRPHTFWLDAFRIVNLLTLHSMDFCRIILAEKTTKTCMHWMHFHCYWFRLLLFACYCCCVYFISASICQFIHIPKWKWKKLSYKQTVTQNSCDTSIGGKSIH